MKRSLDRAGQLFVVMFAIGVSGGWIWNAHRVSVEAPPSNDSVGIEAFAQTELGGADGSGVSVDDSSDEKLERIVEPLRSASDGAVLRVEAFAADSGQRRAAGIRRGGTTAKEKRDREKVSSLSAGMFAGGASSNIFGPGGLGSGNKSAIGGLQGGPGVGDPNGVGGLVSRSRRRQADGATDPKVTMRLKLPADAGVDGSVLEKVAKRHRTEIEFCFAQTLLADPDIMRKVALEITVDASGAVPDARQTGPGSGPVGDCIIKRVRRWRFPEPEASSVTFVAEWVFFGV